jgi:hypothetical protein
MKRATVFSLIDQLLLRVFRLDLTLPPKCPGPGIGSLEAFWMIAFVSWQRDIHEATAIAPGPHLLQNVGFT